MAKRYRLAKDQTFVEGKSKTTNDIPFEEAKRIFNEMSKTTGAKRFRYKGEVYDLEGNKVAADKKPSAPASSPRPKARPEAKKEEAPAAKKEETRLSYGNIKPTREVPRSMGEPEKKEEAPKAKTADRGAGLVAAGALTAAAIAARKKARTSTTTPIKKANPAPKSNTPNLSRRAALGLAPKKVATPTPTKPKATVTAPTEAPKGKAVNAGRRAALGLPLRGMGGVGGIPNKKDLLGLGLNKGGMVKKKKC